MDSKVKLLKVSGFIYTSEGVDNIYFYIKTNELLPYYLKKIDNYKSFISDKDILSYDLSFNEDCLIVYDREDNDDIVKEFIEMDKDEYNEMWSNHIKNYGLTMKVYDTHFTFTCYDKYSDELMETVILELDFFKNK